MLTVCRPGYPGTGWQSRQHKQLLHLRSRSFNPKAAQWKLLQVIYPLQKLSPSNLTNVKLECTASSSSRVLNYLVELECTASSSSHVHQQQSDGFHVLIFARFAMLQFFLFARIANVAVLSFCLSTHHGCSMMNASNFVTNIFNVQSPYPYNHMLVWWKNIVIRAILL